MEAGAPHHLAPSAPWPSQMDLSNRAKAREPLWSRHSPAARCSWARSARCPADLPGGLPRARRTGGMRVVGDQGVCWSTSCSVIALANPSLPIVHAASTEAFADLSERDRERLIDMLSVVRGRLAEVATLRPASPKPRRHARR
jgi:hypothetical protein